MKNKFIEEEIIYTGGQLSSNWIYKNFDILGDAIIAFCGPAEVKTEDLIDLQDFKQNLFIYSEKMLHFLVEHFDIDLEKAIYRQRLLICIIFEELRSRANKGIKIERIGDDIFVNNKKLTVSIATNTLVSTLIHAGINIINEGTPIPTEGLNNLKIEIKEFALKVLSRYGDEVEEINLARCKVAGR
ncbi:DUF366 family protein [bacterium]|nr:DUF366 family protein [bacterium]MBU2600020.1 DUF366 family protein [bacterium]